MFCIIKKRNEISYLKDPSYLTRLFSKWNKLPPSPFSISVNTTINDINPKYARLHSVTIYSRKRNHPLTIRKASKKISTRCCMRSRQCLTMRCKIASIFCQSHSRKFHEVLCHLSAQNPARPSDHVITTSRDRYPFLSCRRITFVTFPSEPGKVMTDSIFSTRTERYLFQKTGFFFLPASRGVCERPPRRPKIKQSRSI